MLTVGSRYTCVDMGRVATHTQAVEEITQAFTDELQEEGQMIIYSWDAHNLFLIEDGKDLENQRRWEAQQELIKLMD